MKTKHELYFQNHQYTEHPGQLTCDFYKAKYETSFFLFNDKTCFLTIGNLVFKQDIGIAVGIGPAPFWAIFFFISSNRSMLKTRFLLDHQDHINKMKHKYLLMISVLLMMIMNSSNLLRTNTSRSLNRNWSINKPIPVFLTLTSL